MRLALTPRWLGLLGVAIVAAGLCTLLGFWQLGVARDEARREILETAASRPVVPIEQVLAPQERFPGVESTRRVLVTGQYVEPGSGPLAQVVVVNRRLNGVSGSWVMAPFVDRATGARLLVLRGFVPEGVAPPPVPPGVLDIVGALAPGEQPEPGSDLTSGQLTSVDLGALVNVWPGQIYNAFVFAVSETPAGAGTSAAPQVSGPAMTGLQRGPPPEPIPGLASRNVAYAIQWWVFALFALWMWWKMVREAARSNADDLRPAGRPAGEPVP